MNIPAYHKSLAFLHVGTEPHRSYYIPYESEEAAVEGVRENSAFFRSLNGEWKFLWNESFEDLPDGFEKADFDVSTADTVTVPRCWQTYTDRGYDKPLYSNLRYPFPTDPPHVPEENPCGIYFRDVDISDTQGRLYLNFEGVSSCFYLFVNGIFAGYSQISHSTSEFEITEYVKKGMNRFTVAVVKWCDGTYLEDQDFFRLSGIFRDVYILQRDNSHIRDAQITAALSDDLSSCNITVESDTGASGTYSLFFAGEKIKSGAFSALPLKFTLDRPELWNAEKPAVYTLVLETGKEFIPFTLGVRRAEIRDGVFLLNGKRIVFAGINRHDSDPDTGYYVSEEKMKNELYMLKRANVNAIRTSHYPNSPLFVELCAKLGFYLIDEADIETHGMGYDTEKEWDWVRWSLLSSSTDWHDAYVDRAAALFERDKNFPCVMMWSLGNESGAGVNHRAMANYIRGRQPGAIIHYENSHKEFKVIPEGENFSDISDVESRMYAGVGYIESYLKDKSNTKPFFMCEYVCSMSTGDVYDYFALADKYENFSGGCIWEWCDHAVNVPGENGEPRYCYGGDFGDRPNDGICCVDGLVYPDRKPRPGYYDMKKVYEPFTGSLLDGVLTLTNRRAFTSLSDLTAEWSITSDGEVIRQGNIDLPEILPGKTEKMTLFTEDYGEKENCFITLLFRRKEACIWADKGYEQGFLQFEIGKRGKKITSCPSSLTVNEGEKTVAAAANGTEILFDKRYAKLISLKKKGNELLLSPVCFDIWKAPNYNGGSRQAWEDEFFDALTQKTYAVAVHKDEKSVTIDTEISLGSHSHPPIVRATVQWKFGADGVLLVNCKSNVRQNAPCLPRFGLLFTMPKSFEKVCYFGLGSRETYPDRYKSQKFSAYETTVSDMFEHYVRPQENGNRFATRYARISDGETDLFFERDNGEDFCFSASHYSHNTLIKTAHDFELTEEDATYLHVDYKVNAISENRELDIPENTKIFGEKEFAFGFSFK